MPDFKIRPALLLAACALGAALSVQAQTANPAPSRPAAPVATPSAGSPLPGKPPLRQADAAFARADTNQDGKLSRTEAERLPAIALRFDQIDVNQDQFLSREEFDNALKS
ncbi:EF-hand domain-containing protein [Polaromonas sp.]|uniref:EF-hand domain-containing protein n=1 Tax=Polaromonas sp. TaxID=1869339 RepID=UPI002FCA7672